MRGLRGRFSRLPVSPWLVGVWILAALAVAAWIPLHFSGALTWKLSPAQTEGRLSRSSTAESITCRRTGSGARWRGWDYLCEFAYADGGGDCVDVEVNRHRIVAVTAPGPCVH